MFTFMDGRDERENIFVLYVVLWEEIVILHVWQMSLISNILSSHMVTPAFTFGT